MDQLTDVTVIVNNEAVAIVPNSAAYTEGFGEQDVKAASVGGGKVEQVFVRNVETAFSMAKFELHTTPENIKLARAWKANGNLNVVQFIGSTPGGSTIRTFQKASLTADYEVGIGTDATVPIEFKSNASI